MTNERLRLGGLYARPGHHEGNAGGSMIRHTLRPAIVISQHLSVIAGKHNDCPFGFPAPFDFVQDASHLKVDVLAHRRVVLPGTDMVGLAPFRVRSLPVAALLMGSALAPYIYLSCLASLRLQTPNLLDAARSLGASPLSAFLRVGIPLLRPALVAGGLLVALEVLNDFGTVDHFALDTLATDFAATVIGAVGNYAEIYDRNVGPDTPLGLERGVNALWTDGGLLYAPPYR